jgi:hypothetical protein
MANEFRVKNGLISDGNITAPQIIGTASRATTASFAIQALSASWAPSTGGGGAAFPFTGSAGISGSLLLDANVVVGKPGESVATGLYSRAVGQKYFSGQYAGTGYFTIDWESANVPYTTLTAQGDPGTQTEFIISDFGGAFAAALSLPETATLFLLDSTFAVDLNVYAAPVITAAVYDAITEATTLTFNPPLQSVYYADLSGATIASGDFAEAIGASAKAVGPYSKAQGFRTYASGDSSYASGFFTSASGNHSYAIGMTTIAAGVYSIATGQYTIANGGASHAEGDQTVTTATAAHAEGYRTQATVQYAHAEGEVTLAAGHAAHAEGLYTTASGQYSHAEGRLSRATGDACHAEGNNTRAVDQGDHAEGTNTWAGGGYSHAEGWFTSASAWGAHSEGYYTHAAGRYSSAAGFSTITAHEGQVTVGAYNIALSGSNSSGSFIIGGGDANRRKNLLTTHPGNPIRDGIVTITGSLQTSGSITNIGPFTNTGSVSISGSITLNNQELPTGQPYTLFSPGAANQWIPIYTPPRQNNPAAYNPGAANIMVFQPFVSSRTFVNSGLVIGMTNPVTGSMRISIYSNSTNNTPQTNLYTSTDISTVGTGNRTILTNFRFNAGTTYWFGIHTQISGVTLAGHTDAIPLYMVSGSFTSAVYGYSATFNFNGTPTTISSSMLSARTSNVPYIVIIT